MDAKRLRIVYMGTPDFAVESLRRLVDGGYNVVGVVTVPDKPAGRGLKMQSSAVKQYALQALPAVSVLQPIRLKDEAFVAAFAALDADLAVVVAFRMLPEVIWGMPCCGTFNLHASLLPQYRGAAPINWAVINGEKKTGVTTFMLNHEIDCGSILMQREVLIGEQDTAGTVHDRMMLVGAGLVVETVNAIADESIRPISQPEYSSEALKPAPKIFKADCKLAPNGDWKSYPVQKIYNKVRGLSPYPGSWCDFAGATSSTSDTSSTASTPITAKILASHYVLFSVPSVGGNNVDGGDGDITDIGNDVLNGIANGDDNGVSGGGSVGDFAQDSASIINSGCFESDGKRWIRVACKDGWLYVDRLQVAGKRAMDVDEFLRGYRF